MDRPGQHLPGSGRPRRPPAPGPASGEGLRARVAPLEGRVLGSGGGRWFRVLSVDWDGVRTGALPSGHTVLLTWGALLDAAPHVAAGEPLPARLQHRAPRLTAVLRAGRVGSGAS